MEAPFHAIRDRCGRLDFPVHAIASMPKEDLQGRLADCSPAGFLMATDISCHALSPGPLKPRAASGIGQFDELPEQSERQFPRLRLVTVDDPGAVAGFLVSNPGDALTGRVPSVDAGCHIIDAHPAGMQALDGRVQPALPAQDCMQDTPG